MAPETVREDTMRRRLTGFNEAGARWPRKQCPARRLPARLLRFNEAGARWPRKLLSIVLYIRQIHLLASMRPGQDGPGNSQSAKSRCTEIRRLQ